MYVTRLRKLSLWVLLGVVAYMLLGNMVELEPARAWPFSDEGSKPTAERFNFQRFEIIAG